MQSSRLRLMLAGLLLAVLALAWNRIELGANPPEAASLPSADTAPAIADVAADAGPVDFSALDRTHYPERVVDRAGILDYWVPKLIRDTDGIERLLGIDFHVVTVSSKTQTIEALAEGLFQARRIGEDSPTGGVLIVMNPAQETARIEVSYTLEAAFPDAFVGRVARDQLAPYAEYGSSGMAVMDVINMFESFAMFAAHGGKLTLDERYRRNESFRDADAFLSGGGGAWTQVMNLPADLDIKGPRSPRRGAGAMPPARHHGRALKPFCAPTRT